MEDTENKIRQASLGENPHEKLVELVFQLSSKGMTRQNIYDQYFKYLGDNQDSDEWHLVQKKFNGDHPVELILDRLCGWCHKDSILLPNEPFQNR